MTDVICEKKMECRYNDGTGKCGRSRIRIVMGIEDATCCEEFLNVWDCEDYRELFWERVYNLKTGRNERKKERGKRIKIGEYVLFIRQNENYPGAIGVEELTGFLIPLTLAKSKSGQQKINEAIQKAEPKNVMDLPETSE